MPCLVECWEHFLYLLPMTPPLTEFFDPLALHLLGEHHRRYERIKAWREAQSDPYFTEVTPQWRREFERRQEPEVERHENKSRKWSGTPRNLRVVHGSYAALHLRLLFF